MRHRPGAEMLGDPTIFGNEAVTLPLKAIMDADDRVQTGKHFFRDFPVHQQHLDGNKREEKQMRQKRRGPGPSILYKAKSDGALRVSTSPKPTPKRVRFSMMEQRAAFDEILAAMERSVVNPDPEQSMSLSNILQGTGDEQESRFSLEECLATDEELELHVTAKTRHIFEKEKWYPSDSSINNDDQNNGDADEHDFEPPPPPRRIPVPALPQAARTTFTKMISRSRPKRDQTAIDRMLSDDEISMMWDDEDIETSLEFTAEGLKKTTPKTLDAKARQSSWLTATTSNTSTTNLHSSISNDETMSFSRFNISFDDKEHFGTKNTITSNLADSRKSNIGKAKKLMAEGETALADKRWQDALMFYNHALRLQREVLPHHHLENARTLHDIGIALGEIDGEETSSLKSFMEALHIRRDELGEDHTLTKETQAMVRQAHAVLSLASVNGPIAEENGFRWSA